MDALERTQRRTVAGTRGRRRWLVVLATVAALLTAAGAHKEYTVQPGDTLEGIAGRHGTTVSAVMEANGLGNPHAIVAGRTLRIPDGGAGGGSGGGATHHVVQPGETLSAISARHGVSPTQLVEWNGLSSVDSVWAGQRISVSGPAAQNVASGGGGGGAHRISSGETLSGIARRFGVSVDELARSNAIADPNRIFAGDTLSVRGAGSGGWHCPVRRPVRFVNDYGITKPGGRFHDGVDVYADRGTPVVAPVAGRVEQVRGARAGLQYRLHGVDGHVYIGTHMDSFGASGQVAAGDVIGTVGTTGNAQGTSPHLHFEIHLDGRRLTNPYPSLRAACD